ncbi:transcriptional regulator [Beijerinckiaceae bacterium]|nr:transcriptional regulator [Beijerinckiaceae bacterium]
MNEKPRSIVFSEFRLDPDNALLWRGQDRVALAPKPFDVLCHLVGRAGKLVTKDELLDVVWPNINVGESSLSVTINALRFALGDDPKAPRYIETVTRRGYRFIAPVSVDLPQAPERPAREWSSPPSQPSGLPSPPRPRWWVGRSGPLEALEDLFQRAVRGERQLVFVTGEVGIGKTTLTQMLIERMLARGVRVLLGSCVEHFGTDEAFLPLIEALQDRCTGDDAPVLLKALRDHAPTWLAQIPGFLSGNEQAELRKEVFGATRERMLREFCELLEVLSAESPLVIIVDDLHWTDYATLDVLSRFARRNKKASVLFVATFRPIDVRIVNHPTWKLHQDLQVHGLSTEIALDRLSQAEVEQYLLLRFDDAEIAHTLATRIFPRSEGQPLFVVSLVGDLIAQEEIIEVEGRWRLALRSPTSQSCLSYDLREMIGGQIDRLTTDEQRLVEAASVAGIEFSAATLVGAMNQSISEVEVICEALVRKGQMLTASGIAEWPNGTVAGHYSFLHSLYQEVLYQRLAPGQRAQLHRQIGEMLEEGYGDQTAEIASVLALHFEDGRDFAKAVRYFAQAADNSSQRFSHNEAATYITRALNLVARLPLENQLTARILLLQRRAWIRRSSGDFRGSIEDLHSLISCAAEAKEVCSEINGLIDLSRFYLYVDRLQCLQFAERALAKSQDIDEGAFKAVARGNSANLNLMLKGWSDEDAEVCRQVLTMIVDARDPRVLLRRCSIACVLYYSASNYAESCLAAKEGRQLAQAIGDEYYYIVFNSMVAFSLLHLGDWGALRQCVAEALEITEKNANRQGIALCRLTLGWLHAEALDFAGARQICDEALDPEVEANPFSLFIGRNLLAKACLGLRDYPAALAQFNEIKRQIGIDRAAMDATIYPHYHYNFSQYWIEVGDLTSAREEAMRLQEITQAPPERTYLALSHRLLARIAMAEQNFEDAEIHISRAISIVEQAKLPLAAWRVFATAANLHESAGDEAKADEMRRLSYQVIKELSETLDHDDPLRESLLAGYATEALR